MGLITKSVKVKWNAMTKKYYERLGYTFTKMGEEFEVKIEDLQKESNVKVKCICDNCGEESNPTYNGYTKNVQKDGKTYCFRCAKKLYGNKKGIETKLKKYGSFYDWCIENNRQDILDRWDYELNGCSPKDILCRTTKKYWFKCNKFLKHKSELKSISNFTTGNEGVMNCKQCNSIAQYILDNFPNKDLYDVWDKEKNGDLDPWEISRGCDSINIWIFCQEKDYHGSYEIICNSFLQGHRCQKCSKERRESIYEEKTRLYLEELGYEVLTEHNCTIKPINPKTNFPLPFDNEIILSNGKHLIVEVHGEQHYKIDGLYTKTKEELEYQQYKDNYKKQQCIQVGYKYLEIPYTTFDKEDTYKKIIDNKVKEELEDYL